jgi:rRNA-processing protein FCF1
MGLKAALLERTPRVMLDTCVLLLSTTEMFRELGGKAGGVSFIIPRTVVSELEKKGVRLSDRAESLGFTDRYQIFEDRTKEVLELAARLPVHYPDNLIVASAILSHALLLTFDDTMRMTALCYGVSVATFSSWHEGLAVTRLEGLGPRPLIGGPR